jgi:site-specific DNA-methyltransferase (adenine-specific)
VQINILSKYLNKITHSDALTLLKELPKNSIDTIITDPPYGLKFRGKKWDYQVPSIEIFTEMLRIAKPGTMLMCFGGSRTFHRIACNIEDAGWEIRDCIMWIYGSGFPKSLNISKSIDKKLGILPKVIRKIKSQDFSHGSNMMMGKPCKTKQKHIDITECSSKQAKEWEGYGTGLKPAFEPIIIAMKPIEGNFANNALKHGVAGFNIDAGRIETKEDLSRKLSKPTGIYLGKYSKVAGTIYDNWKKGRWPSNIILDEEAGKALDEQSGITFGSVGRGLKTLPWSKHTGKYYPRTGHFDKGGASRFFYCAKASPRERKDNNHPTVKPLKLIEYLCKLTKTPTGGIVLDPFAGSGTTALACRNTGRDFIACDLEAVYCKIAEKRLSYGSLL